jgi:Holliday junction resolvase RusA-like endonuclease
MSNHLVFTVPGQPFGKGSVRLGTVKGRPVAFKDAKTVNYMDRVCFYAQSAMRKGNGHPWSGAVAVELELYLKRPAKLLRKKDRSDAFPAPQKPDIDNACKGIFDAMRNAGVYRDDKQIVSLKVTKWWCEKDSEDMPTVFPRVMVRCWEITEDHLETVYERQSATDTRLAALERKNP